MDKRYLAFIPIFVLVLVVLLAVFYFNFSSGRITGNSVGSFIETPIVDGAQIKGNLIIDLSGLPVDSEIEVKLGEQKVRKPISDFVDFNVKTGNIIFYPEVLLVLENVPGGDISDFKEDIVNGVERIGVGDYKPGDEIIDLPDQPPGGNHNNKVGDNSITGNTVSKSENSLIVVGVKKGNSIKMKTHDSSFKLRGSEVDGKQISSDFIDGFPVDGGIIIQTNYFVNVVGFLVNGHSFIELDLAKFGIVAQEGVLESSIYYRGSLISSSSKKISLLKKDLSGEYLIAKSVRNIKKSNELGCESSIEVQRCIPDLNFADVFNDNINMERITKITYNDCGDIKLNKIRCLDKTPVVVKKSVVQGDVLLEIYKEENNNLVSNVVLDKDGRLNIEFLQSSEDIINNCDNNLKDMGEVGVDCGGSCSKKCGNENWFFVFVSLIVLFFVIAYFVFSKLNPNRLVISGNKKLDENNFARGFVYYNRLRRLSDAGKLDSLTTKKSFKLYERLRKELVRKGIKVVIAKDSGKLPKLSYRF